MTRRLTTARHPVNVPPIETRTEPPFHRAKLKPQGTTWCESCLAYKVRPKGEKAMKGWLCTDCRSKKP